MKKIVSVLLCVFMCFMVMDSLFMIKEVHAEQIYTYGDFKYRDKSYQGRNGYEIVGYQGTNTVVNIPALINNKPVFAVNGFYGNQLIEEVVLPNTVVEVAGFGSCINLKKINLGDVVTIKPQAFSDCDSLTGVYLKNSLTTIGDYAFEGCDSLYEVYLPTNLKTLGSDIFFNCQNLTYVYNMQSLTYIPDGFLNACPKVKNIMLNEQLNAIGSYAFAGNQQLEEIHLPDTIQSVGDRAFLGCTNLKTITGVENLNQIATGLFDGCKNLESVTLHEQVQSIGARAFANCEKLKSINLSAEISVLNEYTFLGCTSLTSITIPQNVTVVKNSCFKDCVNLKEVHWNEGLQKIECYAFENTGLQEIVFPSTISFIDDSAFKDMKKLRKIDFGQAYVELNGSPFNNSGLEVIDFGEGEVTLSSSSFRNLSNLKHLTLTKHVKYKDTGNVSEFADCINLETLTIEEGVTRITPYMFSGCNSLKTIHFPSTLSKINSHTFLKCSSLEEIILPSNISVLEVGAFANCENLKFVEIQNKNITMNYKSYYENPSPFTLDTFKVVYPGTKDEWAEVVKNTPWMIDNYVSYQEMATLKLNDKKNVKYELLSQDTKKQYEFQIQTLELQLKETPLTNLNDYQVIRDEINDLDQLLVLDHEALKQIIDYYKTKDYDTYYESTVNDLKNALVVFEQVCALKDITYEKVEAAYINVKQAETRLTKKVSYVDLDPKAWYYQVVEQILDTRLMQATGKKDPSNPNAKYFEPDANITRGMVATIIYRNENCPTHKFKNQFTDIKDGLWYSQAIIWCNFNRIVNGYKNGAFGPDDPITRQDLAVILRNYANNNGVNTDKTCDLSQFKDVKEIDDYAQKAMAWCVDAKLMNGTKVNGQLYLNPKQKATRAECAKLFVLLKNLIKK